MIVKLTAAAETELRQIGDWIANDNPGRAVTFVDELILACRKIAEAPLASPMIQHRAQFGIHRRPY